MGANPSMTRPPGANKSPEPVKKPTLAAVLIVKNEADNLRACLASLDGLVDEIVILDSGSQDETPAIAAEFGANAPPMVLAMEKSLLRRYDTPREYIDEVTESRLLGGVHYRFSIDAGRDAGMAIGKLAVERYFKPVAAGR